MEYKPPAVVVDGSYFLHRTFNAIPQVYSSKGIPTNAINGVTSALRKVIRRFQPTHMAVVFDSSDPTFRHLLSPAYKAHRPPANPDMMVQIPYLHRLVKALGIPLVVRPGLEGDDIVGTLATMFSDAGHEVIIATGDKDMAQLVGNKIILEDSFKRTILDGNRVHDKFGVYPEQMADYLALVGDASDGIAGVSGIGEKTATGLLRKYGTLESIIKHAEEIPGRIGESIRAGLESMPLDKQLSTIVTNLDLGLTLDDLRVGVPDTDELTLIYDELEFNILLENLQRSVSYSRFLDEVS